MVNRLSEWFGSLVGLYQNHERIAAPLVFLSGVTYDTMTVTRIDRMIENIFILGYLLLLGAAIVIVGRHKQDRITNEYLRSYSRYFPLLVQFLLGGLLSVYTIFYFRSTPLSVSGIYLLLLIGLLLLNEMLHDRLMNLKLLVTLYFFVWFSFSVFFVPILFGTMSSLIFVVSSLLSLLPVIAIVYLIYRRHLRENLKDLFLHAASALGLLGGIFLFYALNLVPPVPLALENGGIYHNVEKTEDRYRLRYVEPSWTDTLSPFSNRVPWKEGQAVYCYTSIFAPVNLQETVRHQWQRYVGDEEGWVTTDDLSYRIRGGRAGGFRGYTFKSYVVPGDWRVNVLTENGRILGRVPFTVDRVDEGTAFEYREVTR